MAVIYWCLVLHTCLFINLQSSRIGEGKERAWAANDDRTQNVKLLKRRLGCRKGKFLCEINIDNMQLSGNIYENHYYFGLLLLLLF